MGLGRCGTSRRRGRYLGGIASAAEQVHLAGIARGDLGGRPGLGGLGFGRSRSRSRRQQPPGERADFELLKQGAQRLFVGRLAHEVGLVQLDGCVGQNRRQNPRQTGHFGVFAHAFAQLSGDLVAVGEHVLEGSVLGKQLGGCLLADARNTGNVVDRVAHQSEDVNDLLDALDAPLFADLGGPPHLCGLAAPGGLVHFHAVRHQLAKILVGRHHEHLKTGRLRLVG